MYVLNALFYILCKHIANKLFTLYKSVLSLALCFYVHMKVLTRDKASSYFFSIFQYNNLALMRK